MFYVEPQFIHWDYWSNYYKNCDKLGKRGAVYAMTFAEKRPENYELPSQFEHTVYEGMSRGYYIDSQGRKSDKLRSYVHKRHTAHHKSLSEGIPQSRGFELIKQKYGWGDDMINGTLTGEPLWLCLMIPSPNIPDKQVARWCAMYEQMELYRYNMNFGRDPLGNMDCEPRKDANSYSSIRLNELNKNTVERFIC